MLRQPGFLFFRQNYAWERPIRSIGVRGADLVSADGSFQLDLFERDAVEQEVLERTVDRLRERFGPYCIQRALVPAGEGESGTGCGADNRSEPYLRDAGMTRHSAQR